MRSAKQTEVVTLPDFCSLPVLFGLAVVGAITVITMWLAPEGTRSVTSLSVGMAFAAWLVLLLTVALCKGTPWLLRLNGRWRHAGVWALMVAVVALASAAVRAIDRALALGLIPHGSIGFVRDNTVLTALLAAAMLRYFHLLAQWQQRQAAVAQAQVAALQARIRPHFLFNSMNTVAALVRIDPDAAERTVENLAELFRAALGDRAASEGTLHDELDLIDRYLAIEQLRLGERLHVVRDLEALPLDAPMPRLLLQPLVENAVRHGIQPLRAGGTIALRGRCADGVLTIEIDNPLPADPAPGGTGQGLDNVRQRVAYRFGSRARVEAGAGDGRFRVRLQLPLEDAGARTHRR